MKESTKNFWIGVAECVVFVATMAAIAVLCIAASDYHWA